MPADGASVWMLLFLTVPLGAALSALVCGFGHWSPGYIHARSSHIVSSLCSCDLFLSAVLSFGPHDFFSLVVYLYRTRVALLEENNCIAFVSWTKRKFGLTDRSWASPHIARPVIDNSLPTMAEQSLVEALLQRWPIVLTVLIVAYLTKNRYHNGLNKYPGPFLASLTDWWRFWDVYKRRPDITHLKLHRELGDVVRLGPNTLSFANPAALKTIYGLNKGFIKVSFLVFY